MFYNTFLILCVLLPFQFALNPTSGIDLAIVRIIIPAIFLAWLFFALKNNLTLLKKNKITYLVLLFIFLAIFSLSFSHNIFWSLRKLLFLLSLFPIYFIAVSVLDTKRRQRQAIIALTASGAAVAFLGILQFIAQFIFGIDHVYTFLAHYTAPFFLGSSFSRSVLAYPSWLVNSEGITYMRAIATFPDPHMFSYYLGMLLPWSVALWATTTAHKKVFLFTSLLIVAADIFTFTRGGYIALIVSALIILPLVSRTAAKKLLFAVFVFLFLFTIVPHNPVAGRFISSFDAQEGSNQARIANWKQAVPIISAHPLGIGIGMYPLAVNPNADYREPIYAHNLYLDIAAELGIPAAVIFIALLFFVFNSFWKIAKKQSFFIAGAASITVFSVHSLVESPLYSVHVLPLVLIVIALGAIVSSYEKNTDNK
jgi:putative inorganic carbon (hco3(-)) transporter